MLECNSTWYWYKVELVKLMNAVKRKANRNNAQFVLWGTHRSMSPIVLLHVIPTVSLSAVKSFYFFGEEQKNIVVAENIQ